MVLLLVYFFSTDQLHIVPSYKSANKELKRKYGRLLKKHRYRYHMLLKKYRALEQKCSTMCEPGTPQQFIKDAHRFLSEEHVLFLESQMFLKNRPGTGNRFSRKFMKLMIEFYKRSAAGYRYLKTIFTLPSVSTVMKWLHKPLELGDVERDAHGGQSNDEANPPRKSKVNRASHNSNTSPKSSKRKRTIQNLENGGSLSDSDSSEESNYDDI